MKMETETILQNRILVKVTDFMEKAPGLVSLVITLVIIAGILG